jgi:hypothetical protein
MHDSTEKPSHAETGTLTQSRQGTKAQRKSIFVPKNMLFCLKTAMYANLIYKTWRLCGSAP